MSWEYIIGIALVASLLGGSSWALLQRYTSAKREVQALREASKALDRLNVEHAEKLKQFRTEREKKGAEFRKNPSTIAGWILGLLGRRPSGE